MADLVLRVFQFRPLRSHFCRPPCEMGGRLGYAVVSIDSLSF
jgi:hypothetical protein